MYSEYRAMKESTLFGEVKISAVFKPISSCLSFLKFCTE